MTWHDFIRQHREVLAKSSRFELLFAEAVLPRVIGLDPATVHPQHSFRDDDGRRRRIDFAIVEGEHVRLAIEVDGFDKRGRGEGMSKDEFSDFLGREASLTRQGWTVLRFSNLQVRDQPDRCVLQITESLWRARKVAAELDQARPAAPPPVASDVPPTPHPARNNSHYAKGAAMLVGVAGILAVAFNMLAGDSPPPPVDPPLPPVESVIDEPQLGADAAAVPDTLLLDDPTGEPPPQKEPEAPKQPRQVQQAAKSPQPPEVKPPVPQSEPATPRDSAAGLAASPPTQRDFLRPVDAWRAAGRTATVCGQVAEVKYGDPAYINFERRYPNAPFWVVIYQEHHNRFPRRIVDYRGTNMCATGLIKESGNRKASIIVRQPEHLDVNHEREGGE